MNLYGFKTLLTVLIGAGTMVGLFLMGDLSVVVGFIGLAILIFINVMMDGWLGWLSRGYPNECMKARRSGGVMLNIMKDTMQQLSKVIEPVAGYFDTEKHGSFRAESMKMYRVDGITMAYVPEHTGYMTDLDDAMIVDKCKERGITDITEVANMDPKSHAIIDYKDDLRIKDIDTRAVLSELKVQKIDVQNVCVLNEWGRILKFKESGDISEDLRAKIDALKIDRKYYMDMIVEPQRRPYSWKDFNKYSTKAGDPHLQKARIETGVSQRTMGVEAGKYVKWIVFGIVILLTCIGGALLIQMTQSKQPVQIIFDNSQRVIQAAADFVFKTISA